jgi:hypothetical protein
MITIQQIALNVSSASSAFGKETFAYSFPGSAAGAAALKYGKCGKYMESS